MEEKFIEFLKAKGANENFNRVISKTLIRFDITLDYYLTKCDPLFYLERAIVWSDTNKEHTYWQNINAEWRRIVYSEYQKSEI